MCFVSMGSLEAQEQGRVWWADMGEREEGEDKKIRGPVKRKDLFQEMHYMIIIFLNFICNLKFYNFIYNFIGINFKCRFFSF